MKYTLRDIAKRANVSPATVSNALNGRAGVSKSVQENILSIAREMGYQLNREPAKASRHVRLIIFRSHGMVVMDTQFFSELIESIQLECHRMELELLISHVSAQKDADFASQINAFRNEECAGIILLGTEMNEEELRQFSSFRSPMVVLDNLFRLEKVHSVVMNNWQAGYLAAEALYAAGHRDIQHITSSIGFNNMTDRQRGLTEGLKKYGLSLENEKIWPVRPTMNGAYEDMKALLQAGKRLPEAFFAANDIMAIGCMRAIREAGYQVPEDVSIIGMDDTSICLACTPQLSTVHVFRRELGQTVVRTLFSLPDKQSACFIKTEVGVELVMRDSVRAK
ncbi:MAG: LacI family DNA-binding transcriptional regulator [Clostridia bacterium]|nr:LacI family DNA-binding transcriptional regulator [Clostridia bacterium]